MKDVLLFCKSLHFFLHHRKPSLYDMLSDLHHIHVYHECGRSHSLDYGLYLESQRQVFTPLYTSVSDIKKNPTTTTTTNKRTTTTTTTESGTVLKSKWQLRSKLQLRRVYCQVYLFINLMYL